MLSTKSLVVNRLVCFVFVIFGATMISNANPIFDRIEPLRSFSKRHVTNQGSRDTESTSLESCRESLVCGHAYYDVSFTITSYRRSNRCICDEGHRCVLTNNLSDRKAYVFKCRSFEQSENMFPFPDNPSIAL